MTYKTGQKVICEECQEEWEYAVEDYVRPGPPGPQTCSDESCCHCDTEYTVQKIDYNTYDVEKAS